MYVNGLWIYALLHLYIISFNYLKLLALDGAVG
jgi:hypothetical protein